MNPYLPIRKVPLDYNGISSSAYSVQMKHDPKENAKIYEGTFVTTRYTVDTSAADQRFLITDNRSDTNTLTV